MHPRLMDAAVARRQGAAVAQEDLQPLRWDAGQNKSARTFLPGATSTDGK